MTCAQRGFISLAWILSLVILVAVLGMMGSSQVSAVRGVLERLHVQRLVDLASASAIEEAAARTTTALGVLAAPEPGVLRDLADSLPARSVQPELTRASLATLGVEVSAVEVESSPWRIKSARGLVSESGILQFTVHVHVVTATVDTGVIVVERRLAELVPDGERARVRVRSAPLMRKLL